MLSFILLLCKVIAVRGYQENDKKKLKKLTQIMYEKKLHIVNFIFCQSIYASEELCSKFKV